MTEIDIIENFIRDQHIINTYYKDCGYVKMDLSSNIILEQQNKV